MNFNLTKPCATCPFLLSQNFQLGFDRATEIAEAIKNGGTFQCHGTLVHSDEEYEHAGYKAHIADDNDPVVLTTKKDQMCAGAMAVHLREFNYGNQIMRIASRLGGFNPDTFDIDAGVDDCFDDWVDRQS